MPRTMLRGSAIAIVWGATALAPIASADDPPPTLSIHARHPIAPAPPDTRTAGSSGGVWLGTAGIAVILASFGAIRLGARSLRPGDAGPLRVIGRVSLSPRHSVYLLKVGDRVLILGAGGQGPPSLLGELPDASATSKPGEAS